MDAINRGTTSRPRSTAPESATIGGAASSGQTGDGSSASQPTTLREFVAAVRALANEAHCGSVTVGVEVMDIPGDALRVRYDAFIHHAGERRADPIAACVTCSEYAVNYSPAAVLACLRVQLVSAGLLSGTEPRPDVLDEPLPEVG